MALFNHFEDLAEEAAFIAEERRKWRPGIRAFIIVGIAINVAFGLINPLFFPGSSVMIYNVVLLAMLVVLIISYIVVGREAYLRWPWLDALASSAILAGTLALMHALALSEDATQTSFLGMAVINLSVTLTFASVVFVANFRWFLIWVGAVMIGYVTFLAMQPMPVFPRVYMVLNVSMFLAIALLVSWLLDYRARVIYRTNCELEAEKAKSENLLYNVLPQSIAQRLRAGEAVADSFSDVSVIFTDIVGFSGLAKSLSPGHLVRLLNEFFLLADQCAERHGVEKVKTIGDAYLAVAGGTASGGHGAHDAINFARDLILAMRVMAEERGVNIRLRVGVHTGPVVGGVVGSARLAYDYWGDTMNIASRIEGAAHPGGIAVSDATFFECGGAFDFSQPEMLTLKGVGEMQVRRLEV